MTDNATTGIRLEITIDETNLILESLGEQSFAKVFSLIAKIQQQAQAQVGDSAPSVAAARSGEESDA